MIKTWVKWKNSRIEKFPNDFIEIRKQIIWGNKYIKLNGKCLLYNQQIKNNIIYIKDILDDNGDISQNLMLKKLSSHCIWFSEYTKLKKAMPKHWINLLKEEKTKQTNVYFKKNQKW